MNLVSMERYMMEFKKGCFCESICAKNKCDVCNENVAEVCCFNVSDQVYIISQS